MSYSINHIGKKIVFDTSLITNDYLRESADKALRKLFGFFLPSESEEVYLTFVFTDHLMDCFRADEQSIMSETARVNATQAFMTGHGDGFGYEFDNGRLQKVYFQLNAPTHIENNKRKALSRDFLSVVQQQINSFYTRGYLVGIQQANTTDGHSFLHACSFAIGGKGYVVAATPGAGKSSLLLSLRFAENLDFNFISDDFSSIDSKGCAHQIGRAMAVKSHQLQYFPQLAEVVANMSKMQRLQWFFLKQKGLKYMASPQELFGNRIATNIPVHKVFYLTNHGKNTFEHESMSIDEFARLNANMLFSELYLGMEIFNHALILPNHPDMNTVSQFIEKSRENIKQSLKGVECTLVKVPFRSDPRNLLKYLLEQRLVEN